MTVFTKKSRKLAILMSVAHLVLAAAFSLTVPTAFASELRLYTSMPTAKAEALVDAFEAAHPEIDVALTRTGSARIIDTVRVENLQGAPSADIIMVADELSMEQVKVLDLLQPFMPSRHERLPRGSFDPEFYYVGTRAMSIVVIFDPTRTPAPETWRDLVDPDNARRVIMANPLTSGSALANLWHMVDYFGWGFMSDLSDRNAEIALYNRDVLSAVETGNADYGLVLDYVAANAISSGSSIQVASLEEGVLTVHQPIAILKTARNQQSAQAFIDYVLSAEGQRFTQAQGYQPLIDETDQNTQSAPRTSARKLRRVDVNEVLTRSDQLRQTFSTIFRN